jgi:hypothetical protein
MYQLANVSLEQTPPGVAGMMAVNWRRRSARNRYFNHVMPFSRD